jgi:hypothetical protein
MYEFEDVHNTLIKGVLTPKIQVTWSRHRAWHGETLKILVRTELVKDGTKVKLEIKTKGGKTLHTLEKGSITGNANNQDYKIDWKSKRLKSEEGEVVVTASVKDPALTADSEPMLVDLEPPLFSS